MSEQHAEHASHGYKGYWMAWLLLLILTVVMISIHNKTVLLAGITVKSIVICMFFMHLKFERKMLVWSVALGFIAVFALFYIIHFDAQLGRLGL